MKSDLTFELTPKQRMHLIDYVTALLRESRDAKTFLGHPSPAVALQWKQVIREATDAESIEIRIGRVILTLEKSPDVA